MKFRLFPIDLEGVGTCRLLGPYGEIAKHGHDVYGEWEKHPGLNRLIMPFPEGLIGWDGPKTAKDELAVMRFMDADAYVFQRPLDTFIPGVIIKLLSAGKQVVLELDDWMHGIPSTNRANQVIAKSRNLDIAAMEHAIKLASAVTVSTPALAELYGKWNQNTYVLRNRIRFADFEHIPPSFAQDREKIRIGWMGYKSYRGSDLKILKRVLRTFLRKHPEVEFVNVGGQDTLDYLTLPKNQVRQIRGLQFPHHFKDVAEIDIGLVPLTNNTFNDCKSYLKGMEYGGVGAMVIASPSPEYKVWIEDGRNGLLARTPEQWLDALEYAVVDWRRMAEQNWIKAHSNLIEDQWHEWLRPYGLHSEDGPDARGLSAAEEEAFQRSARTPVPLHP